MPIRLLSRSLRPHQIVVAASRIQRPVLGKPFEVKRTWYSKTAREAVRLPPRRAPTPSRSTMAIGSPERS